MKEYIEREALKEEIEYRIANIGFTSPYQDDITLMLEGMARVKDSVEDFPAADVVSKAAFDQVMWERDVAIQQLREDYGVDLGEKKAADVVEVVRCKDCQEGKELLLDNLPAGVGDCRCNLMTTDAHFYCAYGERRSE